MNIHEIETDILIMVGETFGANSTAFINGEDVLLVDTMASRRDAEELREFIETKLRKTVRFIICTHYFSDHMAGLKLFPRSQVIAHRNYSHTFYTEKFRTPEEADHFVEPGILIEDGVLMKWGRYTLDVFHNPGHTMSTINIDIPGADLLMVGDNIVGNLVYLYYSTPDLARAALERLNRRGRSRVIEGHGGLLGGDTVGNALFYMDSLAKNVREARRSAKGDDSILEIGMEECFKPGVKGTDFERKFHKRNLQTIIERGLFAETARAN